MDGVLSGYGEDTVEAIHLIDRSNCYYLHRAVETWLATPDFSMARELMTLVKKEDLVWGMFIAEAIDTKAEYYSFEKDRMFKFADMCRKGTKNDWGEHTCKPSLSQSEYRDYVRQITSEAIDSGIQVFMFGQVFYQDNLQKPRVDDIIEDMRDYAKDRGVEIFVGAQTNDITDKKYLRYFDFIEGGVGIDANGSVESGPCHTRWWKKPGDWCWGLLWHPQFSEPANNVFVHLDWSGLKWDDMGRFARMDKELRVDTIKNLHSYFTKKDIGFLVPFGAPLFKENDGCVGPQKRYYSPNNLYGCPDEDAFNKILK